MHPLYGSTSTLYDPVLTRRNTLTLSISYHSPAPSFSLRLSRPVINFKQAGVLSRFFISPFPRCFSDSGETMSFDRGPIRMASKTELVATVEACLRWSNDVCGPQNQL